MSRQQFSALLGGVRRPTAEHQFYLESFFQVPSGYLTVDDDTALRRTLLDTERSMLRELFDRVRAAAVDVSG